MILYIINGTMKKSIRKLIDYYHDMDKPLLYITLLLFIFGLFNIVTASSSEAVIRYEKSLFYYFFRQLFMIIGGLIISFFIIKKDTKKYPFYAFIGYIAITFCILYLFLYGTFHKVYVWKRWQTWWQYGNICNAS